LKKKHYCTLHPSRPLSNAAMAAAARSDDACVRLPPAYVLRQRHVKHALDALHANDVTVWIHSSTLGIEKKCFEHMRNTSRILVCGPAQHAVETVVLYMFIAKLGAYEPALVDTIHAFATHMSDEMCRVGNCAFLECSALREVVLPRSVVHMGDGVFNRCTSLTSVTLPDGLTHVGSSTFCECTSLTSVTLPDGLTNIGSSTFRGCTSLTSVILPDSLTRVGDDAFAECTSLASVTIPDSLTHLGRGAFNGCTSLARVAMPPVRPFVGDDAFKGCIWTVPAPSAP
jgi:hypothetical protein